MPFSMFIIEKPKQCKYGRGCYRNGWRMVSFIVRRASCFHHRPRSFSYRWSHTFCHSFFTNIFDIVVRFVIQGSDLQDSTIIIIKSIISFFNVILTNTSLVTSPAFVSIPMTRSLSRSSSSMILIMMLIPHCRFDRTGTHQSWFNIGNSVTLLATQHRCHMIKNNTLNSSLRLPLWVVWSWRSHSDQLFSWSSHVAASLGTVPSFLQPSRCQLSYFVSYPYKSYLPHASAIGSYMNLSTVAS